LLPPRKNEMTELTPGPAPVPMTAGADVPSDRVRSQVRLTSGLVATVVFLTAIAPLATDMYVPAFPAVAGDLSATATQVQLTLTTFFAGMGLGQLVGGPVSDQRGRRRPLVAAIVVMAVASVVCALTASIGVMMVARFVQGFSGGWAMVIGRAVIVDQQDQQWFQQGVSADVLPHLHRAIHTPHPPSPDEDFHYQLELLITGLQQIAKH
jgi:MFS transporter